MAFAFERQDGRSRELLFHRLLLQSLLAPLSQCLIWGSML